MSTPIPQPLPTYDFPDRPKCTLRRTVKYIAEVFSLGLIGGWGFGGFLGVTVLLLFAAPIGFGEGTGLSRLMLVTGSFGAIVLGYVGFRESRNDRVMREDIIILTLLFALAGAIIGAPILFPLAIYALVVGIVAGTIPGVALWSVYGVALVLFTVRRYSPAMDVAAFRRDARHLALLTTWLSIVLLGPIVYLLFGDPTSSRDVLIALAILTILATLTAPFAWWHSKFLIDWWLRDIETSGAG
jgi:hypothetical protein